MQDFAEIKDYKYMSRYSNDMIVNSWQYTYMINIHMFVA